MEINSHYIQRKGEIGSESTFNADNNNVSGREMTNNMQNSIINPVLHEQHLQFQQQLIQLKQQQHLQQQLLIQHFQQQQQQLAEQHEKQLQERIREYLEQQKKFEEEQRVEKERVEKEKLESLKKKEKHEQSAIASSEVKQRLQEFVLSKKLREAAATNSANNSPPSSTRNWHPVIGKYENDFPLRKTASEPNLKVRSVLKQKVIQRRSSPLLRRKDKASPLKRRAPLSNGITGNGIPESLSESPPSGSNHSSFQSSAGSTPIQEEPSPSPFSSLNQGSVCDLTLYSSPSLPNISLGRPHVPNTTATSLQETGKPITTASEIQMRLSAAARIVMPLTTASHSLHTSATLPFYPSLPVIEGEFTPPTSPSYIQQQMKILEQSRNSQTNLSHTSGSPAGSLTGGTSGIYPYQTCGVITDSQVAQARLQRSLQRPLGRTQSAPLPLGHPMLQPGAQIMLSPQQSEQFFREKHLYEQQQRNLVKQHIRQTVLTRASSKSQVVEEETEAAVAQEMNELKQENPLSPEGHLVDGVIDLTDRSKRITCDSELLCQQREREAFLQQQRDLMSPRLSFQIDNGIGVIAPHLRPGHHPHPGRPLSRTLSSPLVTLSPGGSPDNTTSTNRHVFTTGLVYDSLMLKHQCICADNFHHPEHGGRLQSIWARLQETGLAARCERVRSRKATIEEIQSCHSEAYTLLFGTNPLNRQKLDSSKLADLPIKSFVMLPCGGIGVDSDTTWNELHTPGAARMAAGCVTELAFKVATGELKNGFAVVRPPGSHAEPQQAMGFCIFNSIGIAAKQLQQKLKIEKILIVDWDVHHGNGLQQMFYDDPHVMYISLHRYDDGNFFPGTGDLKEIGMGEGRGFNINIGWYGSLNPPMGDAEYLAAFRAIVMPIARQFNPDIVLVAAGFDAAYGHPAPLGGYQITPACFGYMTKQLMTLTNGKVVLALEGGYDLPSICDCSQECVSALLGDEILPLKEEETTRKPCQTAIDLLSRVASIHASHWPSLKRWAHLIDCDFLDAQRKEKEECETVTALASLTMRHAHNSPESRHSTEEPMDEDQEK